MAQQKAGHIAERHLACEQLPEDDSEGVPGRAGRRGGGVRKRGREGRGVGTREGGGRVPGSTRAYYEIKVGCQTSFQEGNITCNWNAM